LYPAPSGLTVDEVMDIIQPALQCDEDAAIARARLTAKASTKP
jgi:hypothetical protein